MTAPRLTASLGRYGSPDPFLVCRPLTPGDTLAWTRNDCLQGCCLTGHSSVALLNLESGARRDITIGRGPCWVILPPTLAAHTLTWAQAWLDYNGCGRGHRRRVPQWDHLPETMRSWLAEGPETASLHADDLDRFDVLVGQFDWLSVVGRARSRRRVQPVVADDSLPTLQSPRCHISRIVLKILSRLTPPPFCF